MGLTPDSTTSTIPVPRRRRGLAHGFTTQQPQPEEEGAGGGFGSYGCSDLDEQALHQQRRLLRRVREILHDRCRRLPPLACDNEEAEPFFAFTAAEVRAILEAAVSTLERLIVLLFLTTGVRIGGLTRLRTGGKKKFLHITEVPATLRTLEKNGRMHTVFLTPACRTLVVDYHRQVPSGSDYLFPSPRIPSHPISTSFVWKLCQRLLHRAGIRGPHAHPHTFRHTLIHLMYMGGTPFDHIAKFVGHANPNITSQVYGRLRYADMLSAIRGVPFLQDVSTTLQEHREEWIQLGHLLRDPWPSAATTTTLPPVTP